MTQPWVPAGWPTVTPRLFVDDVAAMVDFLRRVFNASGELHGGRPAEMRIGESVVMVSGTDVREAMPAVLYVYVEDTDGTYERARAAGATSLEEPLDLPYGDRRAIVRDPAGNIWQIATHDPDAFARSQE